MQGLAFDVLKMLPDEHLALRAGKNMGTLGDQFRHMARVRFQYAEAIEVKKVGEIFEKIDPEIARLKPKLLEAWEGANRKLLTVLEKYDSGELEKIMIDWKYWGAGEMNIHDHLNALKDHEVLHSGQIIVCLRTNDLQFPESWRVWGL